jgi:hypothetical protein
MLENSFATVTATETAPKKIKAKDRRKAQKEQSAHMKAQQGRGEDVPRQKGYKRTKMKFV